MDADHARPIGEQRRAVEPVAGESLRGGAPIDHAPTVERGGEVDATIDENASFALIVLGARNGLTRRTLTGDDRAVREDSKGLDIAIAFDHGHEAGAVDAAPPERYPPVDKSADDEALAVRRPLRLAGHDNADLVDERRSDAAERAGRVLAICIDDIPVDIDPVRHRRWPLDPVSDPASVWRRGEARDIRDLCDLARRRLASCDGRRSQHCE